MLSDKTVNKSEADVYLVSFAEINDCIVFTREGWSIDTGLFKIPDVCDKLGIKYIRQPKKFMQNLGLK